MTNEQAREHLASMGMSVPVATLGAWLGLFSTIQECLDLNYDENVQLLILTNLLSLYAYSGGGRYISSQSAQSGASRSFKYAELRNAWNGAMGVLKMLDAKGCTFALIPPAPASKKIAIGVSTGGCGF